MTSHPNFDRIQAALNAARQGDYAPAFDASGDRFDNLAVCISRLRPDGQAERLWTVDLDAEHCEAFWANNPGTPSKDFS